VNIMTDTGRKRFKLLPEMEGRAARWYARVRGTDSQLEVVRTQAAELTAGLPAGADVLEVAPGPGYLSIELARLGYQVTGLDISRTFVEIAAGHARQAGVPVDFRCGDVADMPFPADSFDLVVCQAAFKNFTQPVRALDEMHRVLRPGGVAVIQDLARDASGAEIDREVGRMRLRRGNVIATGLTLRMLRRRAYTGAGFQRLAADSAFRAADVRRDGIGLEVRLTKR
jgi:ubiquinone/menaquinone biosynthesis C-methylase UbiE